MILLVHPPVTRPAEPPAGIARLSGALSALGIRHRVLDANIEGLTFLLRRPQIRFDTWTTRASRNLERHLVSLKSKETYSSLARYQRAVLDINRLLEGSQREGGGRVGLTDYQHPELSPLRSDDLFRVTLHPEQDPFYPFFSHRLAEVIATDTPRYVGFSLNYLRQALCVFAMIGFLRKNYPKIKIILGGGLTTSWMRNNDLEKTFAGLVDRIIAGPGELPLLEILGVKGDEERNYPPAYDLFPLPDYLSPGVVLPYSGSSGCSWSKCTFCPERAEGNPHIPLPAARVSEDLTRLNKALQPSLIHVLDNSLSVEHMKALIKYPPGAPWYAFTRISPELCKEDFCRSLRSSGCVMLKLGLESGDQGVLERMNKGVKIETASRALRSLKRAGIATYIYLIFGTPAETEGAARKTLAFTVAHSEAIDFLNLAIFNMPAYGKEASQYGTGGFYEGDLTLYTDFRHPAGWDRKRVRQFLAGEFGRHPLIAPIVRSDPPFFGSSHAPFFVLGNRPAESNP